ncbi:UDP-glucuronosyltransferase 2A1-like isoform X2 [Erpetoichthys calabaricus]|uniref:UDP-glucuronosyltransferase 2A1-like isoform X2 n=1 Tax=Erpetoichthys calabaricus TaxID=27687 RepID=UPI0022340C12|nr:UDP-glucuronosyltransferase 2A1-like isoform X2 [Erpetoichthys calabaricus]
MVPGLWMISTVFLHFCLMQSTMSGRVLVWYVEHSHWINIKTILEELTTRGHNVTVLLHTASPSIQCNQAKGIQAEFFKVPFSKEFFTEMIDDLLNFWIYDAASLSSVQFVWKFRQIFNRVANVTKQICDGVLRNKELLEKLKQQRFDVILADPLFFGSEMIAEHLDLPFIYTLRFSFGSTIERLCGQMPSPPSYVPGACLQYTDRMTFIERLKNLLFYMSQDFLFYEFIFSQWNPYFSEIKGRPTSLCEMMGKAEIWLIRTYWDFEFPRPYLPNFQFVGGLHCRPAKALPEDMEEFAQSSGDHGIVVLTFGSMIKNLTREKANLIASALGQIPQKVLWRYSGETPETLAPNTRLYNWIPQNDLLGHPKTRAFITHGGTNGIYEAIYHGIPMVGIPMFGDQPDNMVHMKAKGAAVVVNFNTMTSQDLVDALNTVINNPTYKESAMKLSRIHHDQPVKPLDTAVFWIEFVMRHKGAKHLRPAAHNLTWYQYHCLDVIAFLLVCILTSVIITYKCCIFSFRKCFKRSLKKSKRE